MQYCVDGGTPRSVKIVWLGKRIHTMKLVIALVFDALVAVALFFTPTMNDVNAEEEFSHCVVQVYPATMLRNGELRGCYSTLSEAVAFATNGRISLPDNVSPQRASAAIRTLETNSLLYGLQGGITPQATHVVSIQWDWTSKGGNSLVFTSNLTCPNTTDGHILSLMYRITHPGWDNRVESAEAYAGCTSVQLWDGENMTGANITCSPYCSTLGAMNNATSSSRTWK